MRNEREHREILDFICSLVFVFRFLRTESIVEGCNIKTALGTQVALAFCVLKFKLRSRARALEV